MAGWGRRSWWSTSVGARLGALLLIALFVAGGSFAPITASASRSADGYLLAADTAAEKVYFYRLPGLELVGQLDDVRLGAHAGTVTLPDGRILFVDDKAAEFLAVKINTEGMPVIVGRAKLPTPTPLGRAAWAGVDPRYRYFAVSSDDADAQEQHVSLVDLGDYSVSQLRLKLNRGAAGDYEEVHPYLAGDPLTLYVTVGGMIEGYRVADIVAGAATPFTRLNHGAGPHGPIVTANGARIHVTTLAGLETADLSGATLSVARTLSWAVDGQTVTRNARPRLGWDGRTIYGAVLAVNPALTPRDWAENAAFLHAADTEQHTAALIPLGPGIAQRMQLSSRYAVISTIHPSGDHAHLVNIDPTSPSFHQVTARVPLAKLSNGPVAGEPTAGKESRAVGITPDGRWAFVSHGGEGKVSVIDTERGALVRTLDVPTAMRGGGYLVGVQHGAALVDVLTR